MLTLHDDVSDCARVARKLDPKLADAVRYANASACFWNWLSEGKMRAASLALGWLARLEAADN